MKNAVIVPVGAKGGLVPKKLPAGGPREAIAAEGLAAYRIFISSLHDITDNIEGESVAPPRVLHDARSSQGALLVTDVRTSARDARARARGADVRRRALVGGLSGKEDRRFSQGESSLEGLALRALWVGARCAVWS